MPPILFLRFIIISDTYCRNYFDNVRLNGLPTPGKIGDYLRHFVPQIISKPLLFGREMAKSDIVKLHNRRGEKAGLPSPFFPHLSSCVLSI
jgi:hypothetical protein